MPDMLEMIWKFYWFIFLCCITIVLLWLVYCYKIGHLIIICEHVIRSSCEHSFDKCYMNWGRIRNWRGCKILRDVTRTMLDIISWVTNRTSWWVFYWRPRCILKQILLSRVMSHALIDVWTYMSPMSPKLRDTGCVSLGQEHIMLGMYFIVLRECIRFFAVRLCTIRFGFSIFSFEEV